MEGLARAEAGSLRPASAVQREELVEIAFEPVRIHGEAKVDAKVAADELRSRERTCPRRFLLHEASSDSQLMPCRASTGLASRSTTRAPRSSLQPSSAGTVSPTRSAASHSCSRRSSATATAARSAPRQMGPSASPEPWPRNRTTRRGRRPAQTIERKHRYQCSIRISARRREEPPPAAEVAPPGRDPLRCTEDVVRLHGERTPLLVVDAELELGQDQLVGSPSDLARRAHADRSSSADLSILPLLVRGSSSWTIRCRGTL